QTTVCFEVNNQKAFFKTGGDFPFDIFAAAFYLLTRYEEYLPYKKDIYGRYAHENSLAFKENFLNLPLINAWLQNFRDKLLERFPSFTIHHSPFTFLPTYDIDEAWSFKYKQWWRSAGAAVKDLFKGDFKKLALRRKTVNNKIQDPFDSYEWMDALHRQYDLDPRYFFLVPGKTGKYDRNILPREEALQQLIKEHAGKYKTGVHPSWQSGDDHGLIRTEIATLEKISGKKITSSRQHFIRFILPQTFRYLADAGIKEDFSMGYGSINGFRASVAVPFYWYDLEKDETTPLLLYPFCYMEANSFFEQKFTPEQALEEMRHYYKAVKAVNGTFITIWHNTFLGTGKLFEGWREVYQQFIDEVCGRSGKERGG
ncbi:MAG: polysaccharide deacetylase family protein, partial [Ferruginibacter sp.]|nr:polysaccharide deacetylase family protein [Chitinophagaceae bacterium]